MAHINTVFHQLLSFFPRHHFENIVFRYGGDAYVKHFHCWNQFSSLLYAQATGKDSLRDIELGLRVQQNSWYHLGIRNISRSTLAYANENRPWQIYEDLFYKFLGKCRDITPQRQFRFKNPLYTLDATFLELCLELFPWATFRETKGALKMHCLLDNRTQIPSFLVVTEGKQHEVKVAKNTPWPLFRDSILAVDKAYIDFEWLYSLTRSGVFFVTRAKKNLKCRIVGQHKNAVGKGILADEEIKLTGYYPSENYPDKLRLIGYWDEKTKKSYVFLTNNFKLAASTIALIYKARWDVELFFKWLKQNLKIKTFLGTSKNAVLTQIWVAMLYYLLVSYIKYQTKYKYSLLEFTRIFSEALFFRSHLIDLLSLNHSTLKKIKNTEQPQLALL